jgi:hypothetical protein
VRCGGGEREGAFFAPPSYWLYYPIPLLPLLWGCDGYEVLKLRYGFLLVWGRERGRMKAKGQLSNPLPLPYLVDGSRVFVIY